MHVRTLFKAVWYFDINCDTIKVSIKKKNIVSNIYQELTSQTEAYLLHQNGSLNIGVNYQMLIEKIGFQGL